MQYDIRSDLLIEALSIDTDGIVSDVRNENNLTITTVDVIDEDITKKKKGKYITIEFNDINSDKENLKIELRKSLEYLFKINNIMKDSSVLVIGLGNAKSTADSLGPLVIDNIIVTRHLEELGYNNMRTVSAIKPINISDNLRKAFFLFLRKFKFILFLSCIITSAFNET